MVLLSVTGLFRTLLIILAVIILLRFIGKLMTAKRNVDEERRLNKELDKQDQMIADARKNYGKTTLTDIKERPDAEKSGGKGQDFADFEEIDEESDE